MLKYLALVQDVFLGEGEEWEDEGGQGMQGAQRGQSENQHPCLVSPSSGFQWFLLTSGYILAFLLTLLLACHTVLYYSRFGRQYKALSRWRRSPARTSLFVREEYVDSSSKRSRNGSNTSPLTPTCGKLSRRSGRVAFQRTKTRLECLKLKPSPEDDTSIAYPSSSAHSDIGEDFATPFPERWWSTDSSTIPSRSTSTLPFSMSD